MHLMVIGWNLHRSFQHCWSELNFGQSPIVGTTVDRTAIIVRSSIAQSDTSLVAGLGIVRIEQQRYRTVHKCTVTVNLEESTLRI